MHIRTTRTGFLQQLLPLSVSLVLAFAATQALAADDKKDEKKGAHPAAQQQAPAHQDRSQRPADHQNTNPPATHNAPPARVNNPPADRPVHTADRPVHTTDRPASTNDRPARPMDRPADRPMDRPMNGTPRDRVGTPQNAPVNRNEAPMNRRPNEMREAGPAHNAPPNDFRRPNAMPNARPEDRAGSFRPGVNRAPDGRLQGYRSPAGHEVHYAPNGSVSSVRMGGRTVVHGAGGGRIIYERPDRTVIVTNRAGHGYVQRPFAYRGQEYVHRTYYVHGVAYSRYYRPYSYHGVMFYTYAPVRYYSPAFYGWAYRPWDRPVYYRWGWAGSPWYGYYGGYFAPAPYYASPTLWLVDYMIAERLAESYNERAANQYAYQGGTPLSPAVKQAIAVEVQRQMALESSQNQDPQAGTLPQLMSDNQPHVFVVSYTIDVVDQNNQECSVTRGDVLRLNQAPAPDAQAAYVEVVASKGQDCRAGSQIAVSLQDLQDTSNQMRESVNAGMGELQSKAGQGGLPVLPVSARAAAMPAPFAEAAPPADPQVAQELQQEVQETGRLEQQVIAEAQAANQAPQAAPMAPQPPPQQAPTRIVKGQTINEVIGVLGNPTHIVEVGKKQVYVYPDLKITFNNGRVSDVQ